MKKLILLGTFFIFLNGCAAFNSDSKKYEMQKSPCACIELPLQNG